MKKLLLLALAALLLALTAYSADDFKTLWSKELDYSIETIAFTKDSRQIIVSGSNGICLYDVETSELVSNPIKFYVGRILISSDGEKIYTSKGTNIIGSFSTATWQSESRFDTLDKEIRAMSLSPDGKYISATTADGFIIIDVETGKKIKEKIIPKDPKADGISFYQASLDCQNKKIYIYSVEGYTISPKPTFATYCYIKVYDFETLDSIGLVAKTVLSNSTGETLGHFHFSHDCKIIALKYSNTGIRVYNLEDMKEIAKFDVKGYGISSVNFTKDDKNILTSSSVGSASGGGIFLWNIASSSKIKSKDIGYSPYTTISPDERFIGLGIDSKLYLLEFNYISNVEQKIRSEGTLYPNPTTGTIEIKLEEQPFSDVSMELLDASGNLKAILSSSDITQSENTLRVSLDSVPSGAYFIRLTGSGFAKTFKVIINK